MYKNPRSQFGEISQQAAVVIQCSHDKKNTVDRMNVKKDNQKNYYVYGEPTLDQAVVRIDIGDLVFQVGTSSAPRGSILNGAIPVTSHLNGLYVRRGGNDPEYKEGDEFHERLRNLKIAEGIRFIGAALGSTTPNPDDLADQKTQITVRTQGTMSIFHSGGTNLQPGDTLMWKIPTKVDLESFTQRFGRSQQKIPLMTVPMRKEYKSLGDSIKTLGETANDKTTTKENIVTSVDVFAAKLIKLMGILVWFQDVNSNIAPHDLHNSLVDQLDPTKDAYLRSTDSGKIMDVVTNLMIKSSRHTPLERRKSKIVESTINEVVAALSGVLLDMEKRKIGKVLSYCKPGEKVDVLLGSG